MMVHGIGPTTLPAHVPAATAARPGQETAASDEQDAVEFDAEAKSTPGVIQHIAEGHYRGVADVRLRINFHDQLAALQQQASATALENASAELDASVQAEVQPLLHDSQLTKEQHDSIADAVNDFQASLDEILASDLDHDGALNQISEANSALLAAIEALLADGGPEIIDGLQPADNDAAGSAGEAAPTGDEATAETEPGPADSSAIEELYQRLSTILYEHLEAIELSLLESSLPDLSPPTGSGIAYDKFLVVYEELQGTAETIPDDSAQPVDTVA